MKLPHSVPSPNGTERAARAKLVRDIATETARLRPHALTRANGEEADYQSACFPANFTKGLRHNEFGILKRHDDYAAFVEAINSDDWNLFTSGIFAAQNHNPLDGPLNAGEEPQDLYTCKIAFAPKAQRGRCTCAPPDHPNEDEHEAGDLVAPDWRGWESPRAGHVYDLEGPDAGACGMAPAPRVVSSECAAEMAEVYALALVRDVRFTDIVKGDVADKIQGGPDALVDGDGIAAMLNSMPFFSGVDPISSTIRSCAKVCDRAPGEEQDEELPAEEAELRAARCLDRFERNRRFARTQDENRPLTAPLTPATLFRGSTKGALHGPYISQYMLMGSKSLANEGNCNPPAPPPRSIVDGTKGIADGYIRFGTQFIDQRVTVHQAGMDHMTNWDHWLDVQNGANFKGQDRYECRRRFITTPRDLATYVHFDALYQAYLNAVLILDSLGTPVSKGFPEPDFVDPMSGNVAAGLGGMTPARTGFATFGGPHILSLVTEVATRCLKTVRRQKFNFHRRMRPEALAGRLTLAEGDMATELKCALPDFTAMLGEIPDALTTAIDTHNGLQADLDNYPITCERADGDDRWEPGNGQNFLLPMAFPEGSPMHPAYGAGHATVAGGCVTMVKAFFEMFEDCDGAIERPLCDGNTGLAFVPRAQGTELLNLLSPPDMTSDEFNDLPDAQKEEIEELLGFAPDKPLTIQGELDKLAANISIGRNMAGVHYYSDYYDSMRMGERVAVGILLEQAPTYGEPMETTFTSFDGDHITISGQGGSAGMLSVIDRHGNPVSPSDWWLRHVPGEELIMDL